MKALRVLVLLAAGACTVGCYGAKVIGDSDASATTLAEAEQQMTDRWNQVVSANAVPEFSPPNWNFLWPSFNRFPHPTFRGGSFAAYTEFARLLLIFTQPDDNFQFVANYGLFDVELVDNSVPPGADFGTLRSLINQLASGSPNNLVSDPTILDGLKQLQARVAQVK